MNWWFSHLDAVSYAAGGLLASGVLAWRFSRCKHPSPHYVHAVTRYDEATGADVLQPATYLCYECGKSWPATQRDPAWAPTSTIQKFSGYDEKKAARAFTRAAVEDEQRRFLAAHRGAGDPPALSAVPAPRRRRVHGSNVVDMNSRKPA